MGVPLIGRTWFLNSFNRPLLCCRDICVLDKSLAQESRSFLASTQVVVRLEVEFPSGHFAWGCGVLEDKSLHIDPASTLPLVHIVPWKCQGSLCSALLSISCLPQPLQHFIHFLCICFNYHTSRLHGFSYFRVLSCCLPTRAATLILTLRRVSRSLPPPAGDLPMIDLKTQGRGAHQFSIFFGYRTCRDRCLLPQWTLRRRAMP